MLRKIRRNIRRRTNARSQAEALEQRALLTNFLATSAALVDGNGLLLNSAVEGEEIGVRVNFTTSNIPAGDYQVRFTVDGVPVEVTSNRGTAGAGGGDGNWSLEASGWYATGGNHTIEVLLDSTNVVAETDETDNERSFTVGTSTPDPVERFIWPVEGSVQNYGYITEYADVDPTPGASADYQGGIFADDGHRGWDITTAHFTEMDDVTDVYAAAGGQVLSISDGNFDRNTGINPAALSNTVVIDHGNGYQGTYTNLRRDSVQVNVGDVVTSGQVIGFLGASGQTDRPELGFTITRNGRAVEPMMAATDYLQGTPDYSGSVSPFVRSSGITSYEPDVYFPEEPTSTNVFAQADDVSVKAWAQFAGLKAGQFLNFFIYDPLGNDLDRQRVDILADEKTETYFVEFTENLTVGEWRVDIELDGSTLLQQEFFEVTAAGAPDMLLEDAAGTLIVHNRYTPVDFGSAALGGTNPQVTLTVTNHGSAPLNVTDVVLPTGFGVTQLPAAIDPGNSDDLILELSSMFAGHYAGEITVVSDDFDTPLHRFSVEGLIDDPAQDELILGIGQRTITEDGPGRTIANVRRTGSTASSLVVNLVPDNPAQFSMPSTVTIPAGQDYVNFFIEAVDDPTVEGDMYEEIDALAAGMSGAVNAVEIIDNDFPDLLVTETNGSTEVSETGTTDTFDVVLNTQPLSDVIVDITSSNLSEASVSPARLTFTSANWDVLQTVTVTGVDDPVLDGTQNSVITIAVNDAFSDDAFDGLSKAVVSSTTDDEVADVLITQTFNTTVVDEDGGLTDSFTLRLTAQPLTDVVIDISSSDTGEAVPSPSIIIFNSANWNIPRGVSVLGVSDTVLDGDQVSTFTVEVNDAVSYDPYDGVSKQFLVTTIDNDFAGVTLSHTGSDTTVSETGTTDTVNIQLDVQPLNDVVLDVSSLNTSEFTVSPARVTFTPANWNTAQPLTVTGVDDSIADGVQFGDIRAVVDNAASDAGFAGISDTLSAANLDDDARLVVIETGAGTEVSEDPTSGDATDTFTVRLFAAPLSDVVVGVASSDTGETTVSPATVTFTTANWNVDQTITVTGTDDAIVDGTQPSTISLAVDNSSSHVAYANVTASVAASTIDDEVPALVISQSGGNTTVQERGTSDTIEVTLNARPLGSVVIAASSGDEDEVVTPPTRITFTSGNWNIAQSITVLGVNDLLLDGDQTTAVTLTVVDSQSQDLWDGLETPVNVITVDDETPTFTITETSGTTEVSETGTTDTFTVVLNAEPLADVEFNVVSGDSSEFSVSPTTLTFTPSSWNTPRVVTVTGVDDSGVDGTQSGTINLDSVDNGSDWDALTGSVSVTNTDDDIAGIVIVELGGSTEANEGATDTFDVTLNAQPLSDVVLAVTSSDTAEGTVAPNPLTFTPSSWNTPQTVTLTGVTDAPPVADGDADIQILVAVDNANSHSQFHNLSELIDATIFDVDAGISIIETGTGTEVDESGTTDDFDVVLDAMPLGDVVLAVTSSDFSEVTANPVSLTFTSANWDTPQTVTVTGVDDVILDGTAFSTVDVSVVESNSDAGYHGFARSVSVNTLDDDVAAITIVETGANTTVSEDGSTDAIGVSLASRPLSNVVIDVSSADTTEATVAPATLTFTPLNWNVSQTATVTGVDDTPVDGDQVTLITFAVDDSQSDPGFHIAPNADVAATTLDDEVAGITVVQSDGFSEVAEEGLTSDTFTVVLDAEPTSNVVVEVDSTDTTEVSVSPVNLTFTPADWNVPQTVTATAIDEPTVDGTQETLIHVRVVDGSSDDSFDGLVNSTVQVTTTDNDVAGFSLHESGCETVVEESGTSDTFEVVLSSQPVTGIVFITSTDDSSELQVSPAELTFTSANWNVPQVVTVTGLDDAVADTNGPFGVFIEIEDGRSDNEFDELPRQRVAVLNINDEPTSAVDDTANTVLDTFVNIDVLANDTPNPGSRVVSFTDPANGATELRPNGRIRYTPETGFTGTDTFDYSIVNPQGKLLGPGGQQGDEFGHALAMDGDWAVVGVPSSDALVEDAGIVYVYQQRVDGSWGKVASITAPDGELNDAFGWSVDIDGDTVVVGSRADDDQGRNAGAVYVFDRNTGGANNFGLVEKLTNANGATKDQYGHSVAIDGSSLIVGSRMDDDQGRNSGSAFVYDNIGGNWTLTTQLTPTSLVQGDQFGYDVAIDGDFFLVGARKTNGAKTDDGSAFLFERNNGGANAFGLVKQFVDPDPTNFDWLGQAVDIRNDTVVIGKPIRNGRQRTGEVLVFERNEGGADNWGQSAQVTATDEAVANQFGYAVALNDSDLFVGARLDQNVKQNGGRVYQFDGASGWGLERSIDATTAQKGDYFGQAVAASNDGLFIAAPRDDDNGGRSGSVSTEDFSTFSATVTVTVSAPLMAAEVGPQTQQTLTNAELSDAIETGIQQWISAGISNEDLQLLRSVTFDIIDFGGAQLGGALVSESRILIDGDGAGYGWLADGYHLPTLIAHEMGHMLGLDDLSDAGSRNDIMFAVLERGEQRSVVAPTLTDNVFQGLALEEELFNF